MFRFLPLPILLAFTACHSGQAEVQAASLLEQGKDIYVRDCATCHDPGGAAGSLFDQVWIYGDTDADILRHISDGIEDIGMPAFGDALNPKDRQSLLAYLRDGTPNVTVPQAVVDVPSVEDQVEIADFITELDNPWGFVFLPTGDVLLTEKSGKLVRYTDGQRREISNVPAVVDRGQGGLLDVALDPDYAANGWVYLALSHVAEPGSNKAMTQIVRGKITGDVWSEQEIIFQAKTEHYVSGGRHFGSRITFDTTGHLYFSIGDRGLKDDAQSLSVPGGKIHRVNKDGTVPDDNPFVGDDSTYATIWSYGNRNAQGLIIHPQTGVLWETEHGPKGGDELNVIERGVNYGWPKISYGRNYSGTELTPFTALPGMAQPKSHWTPSIAVCGLDVYTGDLFPEWTGRLLVGSLRNQTLRLVKVDGDQYVDETIVMADQGRVRDVTTGPNGAIFVALTDRIIKITPKK